MRQLESKLDEGIRARPALLDQPFTEGVERERMEIHVACQNGGAVQGSLYHLLTLEKNGERGAPYWLLTYLGEARCSCGPLGCCLNTHTPHVLPGSFRKRDPGAAIRERNTGGSLRPPGLSAAPQGTPHSPQFSFVKSMVATQEPILKNKRAVV